MMLRQIDLERGHEPHVFVVHLEALLVYELYTETNKWLLACLVRRYNYSSKTN